MIKRHILPVVLILTAICSDSIGCSCAHTDEQILDDIALWVSENRQLAISSDTEYEFITTDSLREQLIEQFDIENSREELDSDEDLLRMLGFLDEDDDLYDILLDLYSEQVAGYYDIETKKIYVISDGGSLRIGDRMTFAHEFTHALQDQHYDLEALDALAEDDSEYSMGVTSLIEGDAVLTQSLYYWTALTAYQRDIYARESEQNDSSSYDSAPRYIQESLIFPYTYGFEFVLYLYENGGWDAVDAAYDNPPKSMEQIIHPDKYSEGDDPVQVNLPDMEELLGEGWQLIEEGTVGEFDLRMTLEAFITPSEDTESAAAGWGGDKYAFCENGAQEDQLLVIYSAWDSEAEAIEFFETYALNRGDEVWTPDINSGSVQSWQSDDRYLYLEKTGEQVLLINAPDSTAADIIRNGILS